MALFKGYVDEVRNVVIDTMILARIQRAGTMTSIPQDQLVREVQNLAIDFGDVRVEDRIAHLDRNGHVERRDNMVKLTDDGRSDIQKVLPWFNSLTQKVGTATPGMMR